MMPHPKKTDFQVASIVFFFYWEVAGAADLFAAQNADSNLLFLHVVPLLF